MYFFVDHYLKHVTAVPSILVKPVYGHYSNLTKPVPKYFKVPSRCFSSRGLNTLHSEEMSKHFQNCLNHMSTRWNVFTPSLQKLTLSFVSCIARKEAMLFCKLVILHACLCLFDYLAFCSTTSLSYFLQPPPFP